jgi:hypothetical protein
MTKPTPTERYGIIQYHSRADLIWSDLTFKESKNRDRKKVGLLRPNLFLLQLSLTVLVAQAKNDYYFKKRKKK